MNVKLKFHTPLSVVVNALNMSHDTHDKSDAYDNPTDNITQRDVKRLVRVINKMKHKSIAEMAVYWFDIDGISRACLQELARHRTARLTVKSSRYTLKELFITSKTSEEFLVLTGNSEVDNFNIQTLDQFRIVIAGGNDTIKYAIPEAMKTRLQWQIDGRNLQSFLELRSSREALWEIRLLARAIFEALPTEHSYLFEEYMKDK